MCCIVNACSSISTYSTRVFIHGQILSSCIDGGERKCRNKLLSKIYVLVFYDMLIRNQCEILKIYNNQTHTLFLLFTPPPPEKKVHVSSKKSKYAIKQLFLLDRTDIWKLFLLHTRSHPFSKHVFLIVNFMKISCYFFKSECRHGSTPNTCRLLRDSDDILNVGSTEYVNSWLAAQENTLDLCSWIAFIPM